MGEPLWKELIPQEELKEQLEILWGRDVFNESEVALHLARYAEARMCERARAYIERLEERYKAILERMREEGELHLAAVRLLEKENAKLRAQLAEKTTIRVEKAPDYPITSEFWEDL